MSKKITSQKVKYVCEGCGKEQEYELVDAPEETVRILQEWRTVVREFLYQGQWTRVQVGACSRECLISADAKIVLPEIEDDPFSTDKIDLASLRASNIQ